MATHRRARAAIGVFAVAALTLTACGGSGDDADDVTTTDGGFALNTGETEQGGIVTVLGSVDLSHLDPAMGNDGNVNNVYELIYRQLTDFAFDEETGELEIVGDLAVGPGEYNEDATEWTYTLKDGLRYEDGREITSADVKYGIERSLDPALAIGSDYHEIIDGATDYPGVYEAPEGLDSIETPDDKTIVFRLRGPLAGFDAVAATQPFTPFPVGEIAVDQLDQQPLSSGPYRVEEYTRGERLTLVRNEEWDPATDETRAASPDGYEFLFGIDANTVDQRMLSGQGSDANAMASSTNGMLPASLAQVMSNPELQQRTVRSLPTCTMYLAMNNTHEALSDVRVRQAINHAVDKESVVTATGGPAMAEPAHTMLTPSVPERQEFDLYPTDQEQAIALLEEAGFGEGDLTLTLDVRALPKWQAQAESVQQSLQAVGIEVELNVIDAATFYEVIATPAQQNDLAITGWCSSWMSGYPLLTSLFDGESITDTGNTNISQFDEQAINDRFDEIEAIADIDEQNVAYGELDREIMEFAPVVPLVRETPLQMVGENIGNAFASSARSGYIDYSSIGLKNPQG
ncbi:peptide/nickel transport system substrate-binding protein [Actinoalloteichus hoggarensis]|uniref:Glutathione-binding protein GsiB n=1 Tax=Actinoalloteichus hoggarensis TaxID=1470176 RepID=A0A221W4Q6_9PSEU|nr:ABC transporter substrate-binding protein [Actinoalloteichus hoggarensis]ASO20636.1 Glutathione-binding protein GsiB precursor [Actinoalloteichus hoggarensis]MBB5923677.1 peptide/nickel transport system substrate-binding protein [Actinoalloteichus hoggarensis]